MSIFDPFLRWWHHNIGLEYQNFEKIVSWANTLPQSSFYFWFFVFLSPLVYQIQVWALSRAIFGLMTSLRWVKNSKILIESFSKRIIYLKETFTLDFHHSVDNSTWNTDLDLFDLFLGLRRHHGESKLQNFEIVISKTNTSPHIFLYCWLSSCIQVSALLTQL